MQESDEANRQRKIRKYIMKLLIFNLIQKLTFSRIFWKLKNNVYLSFDDGPDAKGTPPLLDILRKYNAYATFFVVGEYAEKHKDILKKISDAGHTIANHSYSHIRYKNNLKKFLADVEQCESVLKKANISTKKLFRIPYGTVDLKLFAGLLNKGYRIAFWNKDTKDYKLKEPAEVTNYMDINALQNGDVVLLHDYPEVTPHILEKILSAHTDKNFVSM